jgi:hypothetical protein
MMKCVRNTGAYGLFTLVCGISISLQTDLVRADEKVAPTPIQTNQSQFGTGQTIQSQPVSVQTQSVYGSARIDSSVESSVKRMQTLSETTDMKELDRQEEEVLKQFKNFKVNKNGSSAHEFKQASLKEIPLSKMTPASRQKFNDILANSSQYRHMPELTFEMHPDAYHYFVRHPDVAVSIWRSMKISKMKMWQTGAGQYECDGGEGTLGTLEILYQDDQYTIVSSDGNFQSPLVRIPLKARGVFVLKAKFEMSADGLCFVTHTADVFVSFNSLAVENAAKMITPLSNMIADRNFREVSLFLHTMNLAMSTQPGWVEQVALNLEGVLPQRPKELVDLTANVYVAARIQRESAFEKDVKGASGVAENYIAAPAPSVSTNVDSRIQPASSSIK